MQFKGDKPKDKKRKHNSSSSTRSEEEEEELDGWLQIPAASLALGPVYLTLPPTPLSPPLCIALQPTLNKVIPHPLPAFSAAAASTSATPLDLITHEELEGAEIVESASAAGGFSHAAPTDVHHVWVCTRIPDTQDKVTLRSALGRYLAGDELGRVTADREARGLQEEWTIAPAQSGGGFVIKSAYGKVLSVDQMAGGKMEIRCEGEDEDQFGRWGIMMQGKWRRAESHPWTGSELTFACVAGEFVSKAKKQLDLRLGIKATSKADGLTIVNDLASTEAAET